MGWGGGWRVEGKWKKQQPQLWRTPPATAAPQHPLLQPPLSDGTLPVCKLATACAFVTISPSIPTLWTHMPRRTQNTGCSLPSWIDEAHDYLNDGGTHAKPGVEACVCVCAGGGGRTMAAQTCGGIVTRKENREDSP